VRLLIHLAVNAVAIYVAAYLLPGVELKGPVAAVATAVVLGVVNVLIKPVLILLTLPITIVTLGLFLLVINACVVLLAAALVPGFEVEGFWWALLYSVALSIINAFFHQLERRL
jgi:putative membrane protein